MYVTLKKLAKSNKVLFIGQGNVVCFRICI